MAKDARLELGRYISNPFNKQGKIVKQLDFNDLFRAKPDSGEYPWNPSRFTEEDLLKRSMTRKRVENPGLNFASNAPFFDGNEGVTREYEVFDGIGRFNRTEDYSFEEGRPVTKQRPQDQPDFDPGWVEAYKLSPTLKPGDVAKNPMPRTRNPDPNGFLMANAEARVEAEVEDTQSVASLLEREGSVSEETVKKEEAEGEQTVEEEQEVG
jgi:hypothetical protein